MKRIHYAAVRNEAREAIIARQARLDDLRRQGKLPKTEPNASKAGRR